ncbi:hypothetical protein H4R22_003786 [Coemansia sp. RSA 1290]|nr:hypothetical protein H4R22_003786 [Coemansia sp. RSA 1290]KAJ2647745.1 hypothetical protein IWW40_004468 [Coemansia sp. RSA 1250]
MGISAIFKRSKAPGSSDSGNEGPKTRLIRQRTDQPASGAAKHGARPKKREQAPASLSSEVDSLPTPNDSVDYTYGKYSRQTPKASQKLPPVNLQSYGAKPSSGNDATDLYSLRTPPLNAQLSQPKELDPFEDSPPPRPLSNYEDPVYIPPLTLAATLFDDYGAVSTIPAASNATPALTADSRSQPTSSKPTSSDLLSEFNTTYSYLFGSPPDPKPQNTTQAPNTSNSGLLSPASTVPSKTPTPDHEEESDASSSSVSLSSSKEAEEQELAEERRREEERKAAELRSRRREMIKQQVAFERMKERHRRQHPSQPSAAGNTSIARWQKDASTVAMPAQAQSASQSQLFASSATINRGYAQPNANRLTGSFYSNVAANASVPNIAQCPEARHAQLHWAQQMPAMVDPNIAKVGTGMPNGYMYNGTYPTPMPAAQQTPVPTPHPVKLAGMGQKSKNPYLSDISDTTNSSSSLTESSDLTSNSSDASYSSSKLSETPEGMPAEPRISRSLSQPAISKSQPASSRSQNVTDTSSENSAKSQSSSRRRVRFHETVSVVFNTRSSTTEEEEAFSSESDNDSSNASLEFAAGRNPDNASVAGTAKPIGLMTDDAFDDAGAVGHMRYQIPSTVTLQSGPLQWHPDETTSKQSSQSSSRNISPERMAGRKPRPKHRIKTEPLRDHEAEREKQRVDMAAAIAADKPASSHVNSEGSSESSTVTQNTRADPMTEARRALLGHYNVPNPMVPLSNGIPRSNSFGTTTNRTSSVKVIGPQSFARNRYSAKSNSCASSQAKNAWPNYKKPTESSAKESRPDEAKSPDSAEQTQPAAEQKGSNQENDEFNFSNVLQNFSISSFEVTRGQTGGINIRYSDQDKSQPKGPTVDDSSDEDDIPLSAIARSRSEPIPSNWVHQRHSEDKNTARNAKSAVKADPRKRVLVRNSTSARPAPPSSSSSSSKHRFSKWSIF